MQQTPEQKLAARKQNIRSIIGRIENELAYNSPVSECSDIYGSLGLYADIEKSLREISDRIFFEGEYAN